MAALKKLTMSIEIIVDWLQATLRWGAPLIIVSIGEVYAERSGVINMGIEFEVQFGWAIQAIELRRVVTAESAGADRQQPCDEIFHIASL